MNAEAGSPLSLDTLMSLDLCCVVHDDIVQLVLLDHINVSVSFTEVERVLGGKELLAERGAPAHPSGGLPRGGPELRGVDWLGRARICSRLARGRLWSPHL